MVGQDRQAALETLARRLQFGVVAVICGCVPVIGIVAFRGGFEGSVLAVEAGPNTSGQQATMVITLVVGALTVAFLKQIYELLGAITGGDNFGPRVRKCMTRAAFLMLLAGAANILLPPLSMLLADTGPAHTLTFSLGASDALLLLLSTTFFGMARLLERAAAFETDSREIV